ncbi:MAG TPA: urease accessory UreF family protein [Segeticoccus sp.]|uniref:urease accessory protein UreF n=1 Tax=Segeticoccus sp. TaxID=2706531 RepID=UPI002D7E15FD|nr:urease accessory UreF family protein [Segeticoccus sp.]HET8601606.1 urease accessory UreF family protein [Segeticoccus sp.]
MTTATTSGLVPLLTTLQLADSAFPSGRYTLSHGLESFVQSGAVTGDSGVAGLGGLLADQLEHGIAPADGVALAWAHRAVSQASCPEEYDEQLAVEADLRLSSVKMVQEARRASRRTGRGLLGTVAGSFAGPALTAYHRLVREGTAPGHAAVVMGLLTAEQQVPLAQAVAAELYAFAAGWLNAAVRLAVADHRTAQAVLHRCGPVIERAACAAGETELEDLASCTPLVDVMAMRHEQATLRLFMS